MGGFVGAVRALALPGWWRRTFALLKESGVNWWDDSAPQLGAALAYYGIFSLGPLLLIATVVAGAAFGEEAVKGALVKELSGYVGPLGAQAIEALLAGARKSHAGWFAATVGIGLLFFAAMGVVSQLKTAVNRIWRVQPVSRPGVWGYVRDYVFSLAVVIGVALAVGVSFATTAVLGAMGDYVSNAVQLPEVVLELVSLLLSLTMLAALFALMFKVLPDTRVAWRDVWVGAVITSVLFSVGKFAIGLYVGKLALDSSYGAAGALLALLLWIYYSAQLLFFGASFTEAYSRRCGTRRGPGGAPSPRPEEQHRARRS